MRFVISAFCAFLLWAGTAHAQVVDLADVPSGTAETAPPVVLSQNDARWKNLRLGNGTVGSQGCLLMSLAMILMEQGLVYDPGELVSLVTRTGTVNRRGQLLTSRLPFLFPALQILDRSPTRPGMTVQVASWLSRGAFVLLKLDPPGARSQQHWVRVAKVEDGSILIVDPAGGRVGTLEKLYGPASVKEIVVLGKG